MTDREELIARTADTLEGAFDRALATPEGRAAYDNLTRAGDVRLSVNGRTISPETGEVRRERRNPPDPETRDVRIEGYLGPGDPDDLWTPVTYFGGVKLDKRTVVMPFGESRDLAELGAALIGRDRQLQALDRWDLRVAYLWGEDLGKKEGESRLWHLKRADALTTTLLGMQGRVVDAFLFVNARVVSYAELSRWQLQATLHEALGCLRVKDGRLSVEQLSPFWREYIMRRYGPTWHPSLAQMAEAMRLAETNQLPLWPEDEGEGDDGDE